MAKEKKEETLEASILNDFKSLRKKVEVVCKAADGVLDSVEKAIKELENL